MRIVKPVVSKKSCGLPFLRTLVGSLLWGGVLLGLLLNVSCTQRTGPGTPGGSTDTDQTGIDSKGKGMAQDAQKVKKPKTMGWGEDYLQWGDPGSGYFLSRSHNNRLTRVHVFPQASLAIYQHNAQMIAYAHFGKLKPYPEGTIIVQETWTWEAKYVRTVPRPTQRSVFFMMQKQEKGYDAQGGDWRYGYAQPNFMPLGDGYQHEVQFCKTCHTHAAKRDYVYAHAR